MTISQRQRQIQQRAFPLSSGGWGGWMSDPAAIPPPGVYNQAIAGVIVNERSVLSIMTVASCIRVLGDALSGLTIHVHRQQGNRRSFADPEVDPPDIFVKPCADIDREQLDFNTVASWGLAGNAYYHIIDRGRMDMPTLIECLNPTQMKCNMIKGVRVYRVGSDIGPIIPNRDLIHVPWMSLAGGIMGLNPIEIGAVGFGLPIAMNEYASRYFAQGIHPTGVFSLDKPLKQEDKDRIIGELMTQHGGLAQAHTPIILDSKAKWQQISVSPQTAQLLEARAFSRSELCGFYGVPGHLVGDISAGGSEVYGKGHQEMVMGFALFALSGYVRRSDRMYTALLPAGYYARRDVSDLFKTNDEMLGAFINALRMSATATPNECREYLKLKPSKEAGADSLWGPINSAHSDFMLTGGGALSASPAAVDTGQASNTPYPSTPRTPGNEPAPGAPAGGTPPAAAPAGRSLTPRFALRRTR